MNSFINTKISWDKKTVKSNNKAIQTESSLPMLK